ncbi:MAG: hypothetical protein JWN99_2070 [Ilumatobacteraceae bacterium]|jgi:beta-mannanase|nr:hypothetical protein [Ilumatobacteraceae bacterium]
MARHRVIALAIAVATVASGCSGGGSATPTTMHGPCTVSSLLVPSCGAWLGATTPSADGSFDYAAGLAQYEGVAHNTPDILHFYQRGDDTFPTSDQIAMSQRPGKQRSLLFYNWKPSPDLSWRQIADGAADQQIATTARRLAAYPHRLFLAIYHEPENDQGAAGSGMTAADYVAMYRRVVAQLRAGGAANVVFVMNYLGFGSYTSSVDSFYPGDDVVDWIAYDPYGFAAQTDFGKLLNTPADNWAGFYDWATAKAPGKPIMLGEWGIDLRSQPDAPDIVREAPETLASSFPMVKALVYWNDSNEGGFEVRIDQPGDAGTAYGAAYAQMANDPYFNSTSTALAP